MFFWDTVYFAFLNVFDTQHYNPYSIANLYDILKQ